MLLQCQSQTAKLCQAKFLQIHYYQIQKNVKFVGMLLPYIFTMGPKLASVAGHSFEDQFKWISLKNIHVGAQFLAKKIAVK